MNAHNLTYHEQGNCEMFSARGLQSPKDRSHDGATYSHEGNHEDEPPNGHGLI
ncbi:uncharacterized protein FKW44_005155 [Caligus rogercresseyi]|uniref:Uncharacterized protein n=1 Tax=Caligus rogercresseyi TaxID=217165 RepID=A0A7T8KBJ1_CALRO|nr:uncharacterized protein FKW44_005155 [Caligus rogercresseyi]